MNLRHRSREAAGSLPPADDEAGRAVQLCMTQSARMQVRNYMGYDKIIMIKSMLTSTKQHFEHNGQ